MKKIYMIAFTLLALYAFTFTSCKDEPEPMPPDLSISPLTKSYLTGRWVFDSSVTQTIYKDNKKPVKSKHALVDGFYNFTADSKGDYKYAPAYGDILSWILSTDGLSLTIQMYNKADGQSSSAVYTVAQNKVTQNIWQTETGYYSDSIGDQIKSIKKLYLKKY